MPTSQQLSIYLGDGVYLQRSQSGEIQNVSILVAIDIGNDGTVRSSVSLKVKKKTGRVGILSLYGLKKI